MSRNTVSDVRNWRESKLPQWVRDSIREELIHASLSWPSEPKPQALSFGFGSHDSMVGSVEPGVYWAMFAEGFPFKFAVRLREVGDPSHSAFVFKRNPDNPLSKWTNDVVRGPWFKTERDAYLHHLWEQCEESAKKLYALKEKVRTASDKVPQSE